MNNSANNHFEYLIRGHVYPITVGYSNLDPTRTKISYHYAEYIFIIKWTANDSKITVNVSSNLSIRDDHDALHNLRNAVRSLIELEVGIVCVSHSYAYIVQLEEISDINSNWKHTFTVDLEIVSSDVAQKILIQTHHKVFSLLNNHPDTVFVFKECFLEFQRGILNPDASPMHFYRAIECVRNLAWYFKCKRFEVDKRDEKWAYLYSLISDRPKQDIYALAEVAKSTRHGLVVSCSGEQRIKWGVLARMIILKTIENINLNQGETNAYDV